MQDTIGFEDCTIRFGSVHSAGFNVVFCDGSVHWIGYDIDQETHFRLGNRRDRLTVTLP